MFGMGLGEILLVAIVAILFLGPDKLPDAMVKTAKFFRSIKKHLTEAKAAMDAEINITELKQDALEYKEKLMKETSSAIDAPKLQETGREVRDLFGDLSETAKKTEQEIKKAS